MQAQGHSIGTIEGMGDHPQKGWKESPGLDVIQQAFIQTGAIQCGYCTPAMILAIRSLLDRIMILPKMRFGNISQEFCAAARVTRNQFRLLCWPPALFGEKQNLELILSYPINVLPPYDHRMKKNRIMTSYLATS